MKFSTRTQYGLKAILVLASRYGEGSLSVSQIAKKEGISIPYLEQILNSLKKKGFVRSMRGPQGGYVLSKKPSEIMLDQLLSVLDEKNLLKVEALNGAPTEYDEIALANFIFWRRLKLSVEKGLKEISLKDLVDEARLAKKSKSKDIYTFHI